MTFVQQMRARMRNAKSTEASACTSHALKYDLVTTHSDSFPNSVVSERASARLSIGVSRVLTGRARVDVRNRLRSGPHQRAHTVAFGTLFQGRSILFSACHSPSPRGRDCASFSGAADAQARKSRQMARADAVRSRCTIEAQADDRDRCFPVLLVAMINLPARRAGHDRSAWMPSMHSMGSAASFLGRSRASSRVLSQYN